MTFPQFNRKHLEEALFNPDDFIRYKNWDKSDFPKNIIITYQRSADNHFRRKYAGKYKPFTFSGGHRVLKYGKVGFIKMTGIGSPHAVTLFEELIALGARRFINVGTAGGLDEEGIFVCNKAVRDEGTSQHYIKNGLYAYPDKELTEKFKETLKRREIEFRVAPTWTIDAPYRETKAEIEHYRKEGIRTVEMEAAALFTVAKVRNVKIASAFAVSDVLRKKWEPKFHTLNVKKILNELVDTAVQCLEE